jgi:hypothetical protein
MASRGAKFTPDEGEGAKFREPGAEEAATVGLGKSQKSEVRMQK